MTAASGMARPAPVSGSVSEPLAIICPECRGKSTLDTKLFSCRFCGRRFRRSLPIFDFVSSPARTEERAFYDREYATPRESTAAKEHIGAVQSMWSQPDSPELPIVLSQLGDLAGKTVLLLGNGASEKELAFLTMNPKLLVYSDLSTQALVKMYEKFELEEFHKRLTFAAIDAHAIPFPRDTFDVVYAFAMVHHLPDLDAFFASVMNVLKPGGYTVFMDDAFAPLWHYSKQTWLKPLMRYSHKKTGISPEDYRFSMTGGFKEPDLAGKIRAAGGDPWFIRASFLTYLYFRAAEKLLPESLDTMARHPRMCRLVTALDRQLCRLSVFERNQIRLVWGFRKPAPA